MAPTHVGRKTCANCHQKQHELWSNSHHDLATQIADEVTVLGNFNDSKFTHFGLTSTFFRRKGKYFVRTTGADGELQDFEIRYTLGVFPLQQYLVEFPGGRLQALTIVWDSRPQEGGGQRWFHLYPNERIGHSDNLHWTGADQNWNHMCAGCHSTYVKKGYNLQQQSYHTTWSEIDVSCEACHGPGSIHVAWARRKVGWEDRDSNKGLLVDLKEPGEVQRIIQLETDNGSRSGLSTSRQEIETCGRCHSRRSVFAEEPSKNGSLLNSYMPVLLDEGLYHADGQIQDEVYVYGSFLQSKMFQEGVSCGDCHEPHSLELRAPGNSVCLQCHLSTNYNTSAHHFHRLDSAGASCVECHMPPTSYMVIDKRHDHSIRVPRPDLSVKLGIPNACNRCHTHHSPKWAADQIKNLYGTQPKGYQTYAKTLHAARAGAPAAEQLLAKLAANSSAPNIARATAISQLRRYLSPTSLDIVQRFLLDNDPIVRAAAVDTLEAIDPRNRLRLALRLLTDPIRAVRIRTARILAAAPQNQLNDEQASALEKATDEYIAVQRMNADRAESHLNLGVLYTDNGQFKKAESAFRTALKLQPDFSLAHVNLADLYRIQGKDDIGERLLRDALQISPHNADVHHALGLLLVRRKRLNEAIVSFKKASMLKPSDPRYSYVHALALNTSGMRKEALKVLESTYKRHPNDLDILGALVALHRDGGNSEAARQYAEKLITLTLQGEAQ